MPTRYVLNDDEIAVYIHIEYFADFIEQLTERGTTHRFLNPTTGEVTDTSRDTRRCVCGNRRLVGGTVQLVIRALNKHVRPRDVKYFLCAECAKSPQLTGLMVIRDEFPGARISEGEEVEDYPILKRGKAS